MHKPIADPEISRDFIATNFQAMQPASRKPHFDDFGTVAFHDRVPPCDPVKSIHFLLCCLLLTITGCTCYRFAAPLGGFRREEALIRTRMPVVIDDQDRPSLILALRKSIEYFRTQPEAAAYTFGPDVFTTGDLLIAFQGLLQAAEAPTDTATLATYVQAHFQAYRTPLRQTLFTGYFIPELAASRRPTSEFSYPLYRAPPELVTIRLPEFFPGQSLTNLRETLKGYLPKGQMKVVPYFTREEIDYKQALKGRGLEIVWVKDAIDAFFLHIQGSGTVVFPDGSRARMNFAEKNGHPYRAIGKLLVDRGALNRDNASMQSIKAYLRGHPSEVREVLSYNPSYVFFREASEDAVGSTGVTLTPHRSIATDHSLFPKGAMALITTELPSADGTTHETSRLVFNQDTGGAIRGVDRVDLFVGAGEGAELLAGHLKHRGSLLFLAPKR